MRGFPAKPSALAITGLTLVSSAMWCVPWRPAGADSPPMPTAEAAAAVASGPRIQLIPPPSTPAEIRPVTAGGMLGFSSADATGKQTITLVDTGKSWMSVYHVDSGGTIRLVSSRPIDADFSLQLNAQEPLPEDIRRLRDAR